jgi:uncharacterized membrane protein YbhN (UPF0104 family)
MSVDAHALPRQRVRLTQRPWWPAFKRVATFAFFALVLWLVVTHARTVDWPDVLRAIRAYPLHVLLTAAGLALASHALYATFDLISRRYSGHQLGTPAVLATTFISYAFNLNFGSLVGGLAFRFRLYSRQGLEASVISRIFGFSMLTNWLGYIVLAGALCLLQPIALPPEWAVGQLALRAIGAALLALAAAYLALCGLSTRRSWQWRKLELTLPSLRMALLQLAVSCANWMLIGSVVYTLLQPHTSYPIALTVLLAAAVAGVVTHVPAGLGVLEAVFVSFLTPQVAQSEVLAALLVYRAVYYLIPLALALAVYLGFEMRLKKAKP